MTPERAAAHLERLASSLETECEAALSEALSATLTEAKRLSSGMETRKDQRRKGHPYARRHGKVRGADPVLVNFQSGDFLRAWQLEQDGTAGRVFNDDPKAPLLHKGTRFMLGRPVPETVEPLAGDALRQALRQRLGRLF